MVEEWQPLDVLITARTYPIPAQKGVEVSCTGGVTKDGRWIRLFPVPYRFLDNDRRFRKYQWINLRVKKATDARPESYYPDLDSIRIITDPLPTKDFWQARKDIIAPLLSPSLCWLQAERDANEVPTLGFFKPGSITRLKIERDDREWTEAQKSRLQQTSFFGTAPVQELEKIPYVFKYQFTCNDPACRGHELSCTDWEMGQSYRSWRTKYPMNWEEKFRQKFEVEMINRYDTHFFVGTVHQHPNAWIIIGLFYPLKAPPAQLTLV